VVAALAGLPGPRTGKVFRFPRGTRQVEYRTAQMYGGQIFTAFGRALEAADLGDRDLTPHACRHSYASWHMAVWKNPLKLKEDGGWDSLATLEIYMHLVPEGHEAAILKFWGYRAADTRLAPSIRELLLSA
jgi:integrase